MSEYPDDIICALFRASGKKIPTTQKELHTRIFELKTEDPDLYKEFTFSNSGTFPYSALLDRVIQRLVTSDILVTPNPDYPIFEISQEGQDYIDDLISNEIDSPTSEKIKKSGTLFAELLA